MAARDLKTSLSIDGAKQVAAAFQEVGNAAKNASSQINGAFNKAAIDNRLFASLNNLKDGFRSFGGYLKDVGGAVSNVSDKFQNFAGRVGVLTAAVTAAGYAFGNLAKNTINTASTIVDNANAAGISAEKYANLEFTLGQMGVSSEKFRNLMSKLPSVAKETADNFEKYNESLAKNEAAAKKSGKTQKEVSDSSQLLAKKLRDLGVSSTNSEKFLYQLLDAAKKLGTEQERVALLSDVLGPKLGPRLAEAAGIGAAGVQKLQEQLAKKGFFPSNKELQTLEQAGDSIGQFGKALEYLRIKALALVGPDIIQIFDDLTKYILKNQNAITQFASSTLKDAAEWIKASITVLTGSGWIEDGSPLNQKIRTLFEWKQKFLEFAETIKWAAGKVGEAFTSLTNFTNGIFGTNFSPSMLAAILLVLRFTGALGLLVAVVRLVTVLLSPISTLLGIFATRMGAASVATGGLNSALGLLGSFLAGAILAAALIGLLYLIVKNWDAIKAATIQLYEDLKKVFIDLFNGISQVISDAYQGLKAVAYRTWKALVDAAYDIIDGISIVISDIWNLIKQLIYESYEGVKAAAYQTWKALIDAAYDIWEGIQTVVADLWNLVKEIVASSYEGLRLAAIETWKALIYASYDIWDGIKTAASDIWNFATQITRDSYESLKSASSQTWNAIKEASNDTAIAVQKVTSDIWNGVAQYTTQNYEAVKQAASQVWSAIEAVGVDLYTGVETIATSLWAGVQRVTVGSYEGLKTVASYTWSAITTAATDVKNALTPIWEGIVSAAATIFGKISEAIAKPWRDAVTAISERTSDIQAAIGQIIAITGNPEQLQQIIINLTTPFINARNQISEILLGISEDIKFALNSITAFFVENISSIAEIISSPFITASQNIINSFYQFSNAILENLSGIIASIDNFVQYIKNILSIGFASAVESAGNEFNKLFDSISTTCAAIIEAFDNLKSTIVDTAYGLSDSVINVFQNMADGIVSAVRYAANEAASAMASAASSIIASANAAIAAANAARAAARGGYASGGYVSGPGTSTSDSIPAWLSNGEFVVRAAAVRKYGLSLFQKLNGLNISESIQSGLNGFAMGGFVGVPSPVLASSSGRPINLTIGNDVFAMNASEDVAERLIKYANKRSVSSSGRKPSWYGA